MDDLYIDLIKVLEKHNIEVMSPIEFIPERDSLESFASGEQLVEYIVRNAFTAKMTLDVKIKSDWFHKTDNRKLPENINEHES